MTAFDVVDGAPLDTSPCVLLSFSNSQYTGGQMHMAPSADPTDGRVDLIRVGPMGRRRLLTVPIDLEEYPQAR